MRPWKLWVITEGFLALLGTKPEIKKNTGVITVCAVSKETSVV
jgi:hypothetical protein